MVCRGSEPIEVRRRRLQFELRASTAYHAGMAVHCDVILILLPDRGRRFSGFRNQHHHHHHRDRRTLEPCIPVPGKENCELSL